MVLLLHITIRFQIKIFFNCLTQLKLKKIRPLSVQSVQPVFLFKKSGSILYFHPHHKKNPRPSAARQAQPIFPSTIHSHHKKIRVHPPHPRPAPQGPRSSLFAFPHLHIVIKKELMLQLIRLQHFKSSVR